jgi:general secretion pathway protein D
MKERARRIGGFVFGVVLALTSGASAHAQNAGVLERGDSVHVRFIDAELRVVVQALSQYLDHPVVIGSLGTTRVTLETPRPVNRSAILPLMRGLLESQRLRLVEDTAARLFRVDAMTPEPTAPEAGVNAGEPQPRPILQLYTIRLKHARAADVAATVNTLYGRASAVGEIGARRPPLGDQLQATRANTTAVPPAGSSAGAAPRLVGSLSGEVIIVPDPGTNALMVRANERDHALIREAVLALDIRPLQVMIEVLIAEIRKDRGFAFGVDAAVPQTNVPGSANTTIGGSTAGAGLGDFALSVMNVGGVDLNATLRAAASRGDVSIVSRPVLLAANNEMAQILVGSQRPFVQVSRSLPTDAPQRDQVVQYKDVGTQLQVRPTISADGYVMLEVTQEVNAVTTETAFDAPVISTRSVQTRLLVKDGQTAVLGGLADRQRDASQGGVPFFSSIPLLGGLFGRASRRTTETELFIFITPTVLYQDSDVDKVTQPVRGRAGERP